MKGNKIFYTDNGMGTGKTTRLILYLKEKHLNQSLGANIIFLDTIKVMRQYEEIMMELNIPFISFKNVNGRSEIKEFNCSDEFYIEGIGVTAQLKHIIDKARYSDIIILATKQALKKSNSINLNNWFVFFDENIEINESKNYRIGLQLIDSIIQKLVGTPIVTHQSNKLILSLDNVDREVLDQFILEQRITKNGEDLILDILSLIRNGYEFVVSDLEKIKNGGLITLGIPKLFEIDKLIKDTRATTFLASGFTKTFTYLYLKSKGYEFIHSPIHQEYEEDFRKGIEIIPLLDTNRFSKYMLMNDKELLPLIEEKIKEITEGRPYLSHQYSWHGDVYRQTTGEALKRPSNRKIIPFHIKGMNNFIDYNICISFIHGNVSRAQESINEAMLRLYHIDIEDGLEALRFERGIDIMAQALLRTNARLREGQKEKSIFIVPTLKMAHDLKTLLKSENIEINNKHIIQRSIKNNRNRELSEKQKELLDRHKKCIKLHNLGYSYSEIAEKLGLSSKSIVSRAVNHKRLIELIKQGY